MAEHKDYGLTGVNQSVQLGKQGPHLKSNGDGTFNVVDSSGSTLTSMNGSNGTIQTHFVTKAQLDSVVAGSNAGVLTLGDSTDSSWTDGAVQTLTTDTSVTDAIDALNEGMENVRNNTFVKSVDTTVDVASGGAPLTSTLTITTVGNANRYTIDWGDGSTDTALTDSTPTHTYTDNTNSPFDVVVTAFNNSGSGEGSSATVTKSDFISLFTGDPAVDFAYFAASSGGSAITDTDAGSAYYLENTTTNIGSATIQYTIDWGDSQADTVITDDTADGGSAGGRLAHTFDTVAETEQSFTTEVTLDSHSTADASVIPTSDTLTIRQYATHTPEVTLDDNSGVNESGTSGHIVTFTNGTENTIGDYSTYGIRYRYQWGDGSSDTYVNTGSGSSGDTGGTITHTYALSSSDQADGNAQDFTGNLSVISNHTSSPFISSNFTVHVEPDVRGNFNIISTTASLRASGDAATTMYKGTDLSGNNRALLTLENTSENADEYDLTQDNGANYQMTNVAQSSGVAGTVGGANIELDYSNHSVNGHNVILSARGTPDITAQSQDHSEIVQVEDVPSAPAGVSSKTLSLSTSSNEGSSTKLASGAIDTISSGLSAGDSLNTSTVRRYDSTTSVSTNTIDDAYNSSTGTVSARVDGVADGAKAFSTATGETGTFTSLVITAEGDAYNEISSTTYPQNFYQVFSGRVTKDISSLDHGVHSLDISHSTTGDTNKVFIVKDNMTTTPSVDISSATLEEETNGTLRYVSGVPYYNDNSATIKLVGATVTNLTGQAYLDSSSIFDSVSGTNTEGTSSSAITQASSTYAEIDGASSMLSGSTPLANVGVGGAYALGNISIDITNNPIDTVETIKFRAQNMNGYSSFTSDHTTKIQVWKATPSFDETAIPVADSLGAGFDDDGKRITGFSGTGDTPTIAGSTNFYTANGWNGAETIAGTSEAVMRFNTLQHYDTDLSSGYLPVGPDLATGRSGAQYFTFAFRRTTMSNFTVTLTGTISGLFIAAPGTDIDDASTLNGWLDCSSTYGGAGTPGADTSNGGNGSNGCAFTSGDRIVDGTSYNLDEFTFTLGDQNATNSTGNNILVRIKLEDGDSLTALSID